MKTVIGIIALLIWSNLTLANDQKVQKELTLLNIGVAINTTLKNYHSACNALVDFNGNKVITREVINEPKPINVNRPKRAASFDNEIKPIHISQPKREVQNEINPIDISGPKSLKANQLVNCHQYRKELASNLFDRVHGVIDTAGQNISEYSEVMDFVDQLVSNMYVEQVSNNELDALLNTKRLYAGLELIELIIGNGLVPPAHLFVINTFIDTYKDRNDYK